MKQPAYYQPILSNLEWESGELASFMVYKHYENAKRDYPHHTIGAYQEGDIEEPTFVDENDKLTIIEKIKTIIQNYGSFNCNEIDGHDGSSVLISEVGSVVANAETFNLDSIEVEMYRDGDFSSDSFDSYTEDYEKLTNEQLEEILTLAELYEADQIKTEKRIS